MSENLQNWKAYLSVASLSDIGMRRSNNQDNLSISLASNFEQWQRRGHLFIVADGMGAHAAGELASKMAVDTIPHLYGKYDDIPAHEALHKSVVEANAEIHRRGQANEEFHNMGTTCSTLLLLPQGAVVAHVGDSRVYRLRQNRFEQLTFDHSLVWEMRKSGQLSEEELQAGKIPKNVITRSLGPYPESKVDLEGPFPIMVNDTFLLCSDGLTGLVSDAELGAILSNLPPEEAVQVLVDLTNLRGGHDNITCIVVQVKHPQLATTAAGHAASAGSRTGTGSGIHPLTYALLLGSIATAVAFYLMINPLMSIIPAVIFVGSLIWLLVQLLGSGGFDPEASMRPLGEGPYVKIKCASEKDVAIQLRDITTQLIEVFEKQNLKIDRDALDKLLADAKKVSGSEAVQAYSRCISFMMDQLRNQ
jgi:protein phosphatase